VDKAELQKIAKIARLRLTETEEAELQKQINDILKAFKEVQELGGKDELTYMTLAESVLREDGEPVQGENVIDNIPKMDSGFVKTPKGI